MNTVPDFHLAMANPWETDFPMTNDLSSKMKPWVATRVSKKKIFSPFYRGWQFQNVQRAFYSEKEKNSKDDEGMEATGLFGKKELKTAEGWKFLTSEALRKGEKLIQSIVHPSTSPTDVVQQTDDLSKTICQVVDSAELCRKVHPNRNFQEVCPFR